MGLLILAGVYRSRGEATASLWDGGESGRAIFRATMSLKVFHVYSKLVRFDDRETRAERRTTDKLAAVRKVWDAWVERLPILYNLGITSRWMSNWFRSEYMPNKPARYQVVGGLRCQIQLRLENATLHGEEAHRHSRASSAAGREEREEEEEKEEEKDEGRKKGKGRGGSEKNQGTRVVLDVTKGLTGRNITCDNSSLPTNLRSGLLLERKTHCSARSERTNRATGRPARAPRETGPLLQVRLHTRHRSGLVSGQEKQERAAISTFHTRTADVVGRRAEAAAAVVKTHRAAVVVAAAAAEAVAAVEGSPPLLLSLLLLLLLLILLSSAAADNSTAPVNPPLPASKRRGVRSVPPRRTVNTQRLPWLREIHMQRLCAPVLPAVCQLLLFISERGSV
ncbi:hypothetical protein D5F01_LYC23985 [Larimichthys crocea]|uniref:PiggyBac transposable element-derived protein domain-containing protein n=1 Tax=Larimichthys crocea TaxID=215358 RepID=A0A6G0HFH0_LARCR|nr:hypothetical protein D5F01_LYC23985 [Larimichthys crocea]